MSIPIYALEHGERVGAATVWSRLDCDSDKARLDKCMAAELESRPEAYGPDGSERLRVREVSR